MERKYSNEQIKTFEGYNLNNVEEEANNWLKTFKEEYSGIQVRHTKSNTVYDPSQNELHFTLILFYRSFILIEEEED